MLGIIRRLGLGLLLIAATSALLLLSDLRSRVKPVVAVTAAPAAMPVAPARTMRVALLQHASQAVLDQGRDGMLAGLAEQGWREGVNLDLKRYNAEGDMPVGQTIAKEMAGGGYDLLMTISTPSLQAVANANKAGKTSHVFGLVTDPYAAGVGISRDNHLDHPAHLAGYGTMQPVALAFQTAREMNPALATVGVVWSTGEANSEVQIKLARKVCADLGITLLEAGIENSAGVGESAAALVARGVDALWVSGDVSVMTAIDSVIAAARKGRIPVFTVVPSNIKRGVLFDLGANYFEVGRIVGVLAGEVLNGRSPASVAVENRLPASLTLNLQVPAGLKDRWTISDAVVKRATGGYIDAQGLEHVAATAAVTPAIAVPAPAKVAPAVLPRVAIVQHNTQAVFDAGVQGMLDGLAEGGFRDGENIVLRKFNPLGDINLANAVAVEVAQGGYDLILTATTPSLQTVANANRSRHTPHLFALVADPAATGVGISATDPLDHPSHLSGYGTRLPVTTAFRIAREINPALKTVGTLWNSSEVNSEVQLRDARAICKELGITLVEVNVDSTNAVAEATAVLLGREVEAVFIPGDITVLGAVNNVLETARRAGVPVFSLFPSAQPKGELFNVGADYRAVGRKAGLLAAEVLRGRPVASIPVENFVPERLALNDQVRAQLRDADRWRFPAALRARAGLYVDADGKLENRDQPAATATPPTSAATSAPAAASIPRAPANGPVRRIAVAYFAPEPSWDDCYQGLIDELRALGYEQGKNLIVRSANTQGESANILPILQNYASSDADVLVTFSTPMLQGALATIRNKPIVFTYCTDPIAAGAGKSWTDHDPRVTGVGTMVPVAEGIRVLRALFPNLKRLGTLYNAGEVNSTRVIDLLRPACRDAGIELVAITVAATGDVPQAAQALASRQVEAIYLPNDNLVYQAFPAVMQVADRARLPVFNGDPAYVGQGVLASVGPGYYAAGQAGARKLARVLAGESPATIPMENVSINRVAFDRAVARKLGLSFDEALLKSLETPAPTAAPTPAFSPAAPAAAQKPAPAPAAVAKPAPVPLKIAFAYYSPEPGVEACMRGVLDGLRDAGYKEGRNLDIRRAHAQGEVGYITTMLQNFDHSDADIIVAFSTAVIQSACTQVKNKPVVFTYCTDPIATGVGRSWADHTAHITGIGSFPPIEATVDLIRRAQPGLKRLGTLYNGGEANSVSIVEKLREVCRERAIELEEVTVASTGEVVQATQALAARRIDAVYLPSDNTAYLAFDALVGVLNRASLPLYIDDVEFLDQGALVAIGPGHYYSGKAVAPLIARIAAGESPAVIPMANVSVQTVKFNRKVAARFGITEALLREFDPLSTASSAPAPIAPVAVAAPVRKLTKPAATLPARLDVVFYNESPPAEETLAGFNEELARGPLLPGRDLDIHYHNAQGDMATLSGIFDAALTDRPALLVPFSTPALQVAVGKTRRGTPNVVFGMVANPVAAGAGRTYEDHLAHITGISVRAPAPRMVDILKRNFPQFKRVGTLFCPAEVNSVDLKEYFTSVAAAQGITVEAIAVNTPTEIADAALALASSRIDAIVQISDNISSSGFAALTRAARSSRMPLISMNSLMIAQGAALAVGHDYHDVGIATANRVQRVLAGEDPATIPFEQPTRIHFIVNTANARATGLVLPESLLKEAEKVITD